MAAAKKAKGGTPRKDYPAILAEKYETPSAALADACEAMFNLNRYTRHATCSDANRQEILGLKNQLIEHLYLAESFTDRVEKLTKTLPAQECWCDGDPHCEKCDGTGVYREAREVASYLFAFTVDGQRYTWMQPDFAMSSGFAERLRVEETRPDDGAARELDSTLNIPRGKLAEAKALVRWAIASRGEA